MPASCPLVQVSSSILRRLSHDAMNGVALIFPAGCTHRCAPAGIQQPEPSFSVFSKSRSIRFVTLLYTPRETNISFRAGDECRASEIARTLWRTQYHGLVLGLLLLFLARPSTVCVTTDRFTAHAHNTNTTNTPSRDATWTYCGLLLSSRGLCAQISELLLLLPPPARPQQQAQDTAAHALLERFISIAAAIRRRCRHD
jgi:hypothetical protein